MPTPRLYNEDQFPLDEDAYDGVPADQMTAAEPLSVIVAWTNLAESPTQAVDRLTREVTEQIRQKMVFQERIDRLDQFIVRRADTGNDTNVIHKDCGDVVSYVRDGTGALPLSVLYERAIGHDCSIRARIERKGGVPRGITAYAVALLDGAYGEATNPEYLRALTEMVMDAADLPAERKGEVARYLWETANTSGDLPEDAAAW